MTNKEIAAILNVTPAAVSMALHNKGGVSESKRKRILELKYASSTRKEEQEKKKGRLLFVMHVKLGNVIAETNFFVTLMSTIQEHADRDGYFVDIIRYDSKVKFEDFFSQIDMQDVSGILVLATEINQEDAEKYRVFKKPVVFIDNYFECGDYDCVLMDNMDGIQRAVRYGYEMGHRNIGFVRSTTNIHNFQERYDGFLKGMKNVGLSVFKKYIYHTKCTTDGAYEDMCEIIAKTKDLPTLLIVCNDVMAIGIMNALKYSYYKIPRDISVISFDNMPITRYFSPALTSVSIQDNKIGKIAVDRLIEKIEHGKDDYFMRSLVGVGLEIRDSVSDLNDILKTVDAK